MTKRSDLPKDLGSGHEVGCIFAFLLCAANHAGLPHKFEVRETWVKLGFGSVALITPGMMRITGINARI